MSQKPDPTTVELQNLSWTDIAALDKQNAIVLIPFGILEEHGPHLPISSDIVLE